MRIILSIFLLLGAATAKPARPAPDLLFLENPHVKIGIDRAMGASTTWLSWRTHPENIINIHDPGRLIQQSYYAGKSLDRRADGQHKAWSPWSWNPIQGGGVMSWARVTRFEKLENRKLISETIPKLWDMPDEEAEAVMFQSSEFEPGMPNVILVRNRLVCKRRDGDRWGPAVPRHQELPACYFISAFRHVESYLGNGEWKPEQQPPGPPWGKAQPPLNAMACFNDAGQGVAIFSPQADAHWNFGPHVKFTPDAKPTDGPCVHLAPIATVALGPASTFEYAYWVLVGDKEAIRRQLDKLIRNHPQKPKQKASPQSGKLRAN